MVLIQHELKNGYIGERMDVISLTLDKSSLVLTTVGQTEQITATVDPVGAKVTWSSSDTTVATVDSTGLVTCVTPGNCIITAESFGVTATCSIMAAVEYVLLSDGGAINRYSELTRYGMQDVSNNTTNWEGVVVSTDWFGVHYKAFDDEIIGFEIVQYANGNSYNSVEFQLAPEVAFSHSQNQQQSWLSNSLSCSQNTMTYQGSNTGNVYVSYNGTSYINAAKNNSTTVITWKGQLNNGVWSISLEGANGQSWNTTISGVAPLYVIGFRASRWGTGNCGYWTSAKVVLLS